jgi:hypothetical protein
VKIDDLKHTEVIELVEIEPILEIITEQEQRTEKAYKGMIENFYQGWGSNVI